MTQTINITFYAGNRSMSKGITNSNMDMVVSPQGLAKIAEVGDIIEKKMNGLNLKSDSNYLSHRENIIRDAIVDFAIEKYEIAAKNVEITEIEISGIIQAADQKIMKEQQEQAAAKEKNEKERIEKEQAAAAQKQKMSEARELLLFELKTMQDQINELTKQRDEYYTQSKASRDEVRDALIEKMIDDGEIEREEEKTVTYKIVREDEEE